MTSKKPQAGLLLNNREIQAAAFFAISLVIFNIAFLSSNGWARLTWNSLGYLSLFYSYRIARLSIDSIGLAKSHVKTGLKYAAYVIAIFLAVMFGAFIIDKTLFMDSRYHHGLTTTLYSVVILLPLKTVFFEELAFRGILPAIVLKFKNQQRFATIVSSLSFGFWHIISATKIGDYHLWSNFTVPNALVVIGVFVATSSVGYLLCELRWRSGSLTAPIAVHWFINGFGTILASLAWS